ncbi:MAG: histidine kinase dimerization/phosphoacceptor domain -containing protein, partial [Chromatiales bacterium]
MNRRLKGAFDSLPIRRKLVVITAVTTLVSVIAGFSLVIYDRVKDFAEQEVSRVSLIARIAADFSVAPVSFVDREGALERMGYLETTPEVMRAQIVDANGELFVSWHRPGLAATEESRLTPRPFSLAGGTYTVSESIVRAGRPIGTLRLQASTAEVWSQVRRYLALLALVLGTVLMVSLALAAWLQQSISGPIIALAAVTRNISKREDYSRRVRRDADDEIGDLYRGFNNMLARIQEQQAERERIHARLAAAYDELEQRVEERTRELREVNRALETEVSERIQAEQRISRTLGEKEVLLREIHHRVKNNLQVVYSLLSLQSRDCEDSRIMDLLEDSRQRVKTMAIVHETLYDSPELGRVSAQAFVSNIADNMLSVFHPERAGIRIEVDVDPIDLNLDQAVPAGLIINELVTNSIKYAYPDERAGAIRIELHLRESDRLELCVCDDGVGVPDEVDIDGTRTLGLRLVTALAAQLRGRLDLGDGPGAQFRVRFPM